MKIKRLITKGGVNPNFTPPKPYKNMEEKLQEYYNKHNNCMPVTLPEIHGTHDIQIRLDKIIGYSNGFDDYCFDVELNEFGENFLKNIDIERLRIQIVFEVPSHIINDDEYIMVNHIIKLCIIYDNN